MVLVVEPHMGNVGTVGAAVVDVVVVVVTRDGKRWLH